MNKVLIYFNIILIIIIFCLITEITILNETCKKLRQTNIELVNKIDHGNK